jgi:hypothetical protein
MNDLYYFIYSTLGPILFIAISLIGVRLLFYWWSFIFHWKRYRSLKPVSTAQLKRVNLPYLKIQTTTRGSQGSTEVILRGIKNVLALASEDPEFYKTKLSVEVVTESDEQSHIIKTAFASAPIKIDVLVMPMSYQTKNFTQLKARGLHYAVEQRRAGWNKVDGRTFIVHYDEESVMTPSELRKLFMRLATTDKKILEGPIYYPLEYMQASPLCRAMEANRPIGCYECRHVMESGLPLHLHGSNLIIDEDVENEIGWDIGSLDGQAFISEDYVFGMNAFVKYGKEVFGWHGCAMLEQPPFSVKSAFKQRYRWIFGVLQGMTMVRRLESYRNLPISTKLNIIWGTRFRIATFALGAVVGLLSCLVMPLFTARAIYYIFANNAQPLPEFMNIWLAVIGIMWIGSIFIGSWYNIIYAGLDKWTMIGEMARTIVVAPIAGLIESSAALWAVVHWVLGKRTVNWIPTPKTKAADLVVNAMGQAE